MPTCTAVSVGTFSLDLHVVCEASALVALLTEHIQDFETFLL